VFICFKKTYARETNQRRVAGVAVHHRQQTKRQDGAPMNRAERRRNNRNAPRALRAFAAAYRCPDCLSETTEPYHGGDRWHINVHHDDTCPMYRRLIAKGLAT
jgi:hypothetical protein